MIGHPWRARVVAIVSLTLFACAAPGAEIPEPSRRQPIAPDSIVLEKSRCLGPCRAYRLRITGAGAMRFESRNPGSEGRAHEDVIASWVADTIVAAAARAGFWQLPERTLGSELCPVALSDVQLVTLTIHAERMKRVEHYTGCYLRGTGPLMRPPQLIPLDRLIARIDSLADSPRLLRATLGPR